MSGFRPPLLLPPRQQPVGLRPPGAGDVVQGLGLSIGQTGNPYLLRGAQDTEQTTQGIWQVQETDNTRDPRWDSGAEDRIAPGHTEIIVLLRDIFRLDG